MLIPAAAKSVPFDNVHIACVKIAEPHFSRCIRIFDKGNFAVSQILNLHRVR
jgi:hypothetical protein